MHLCEVFDLRNACTDAYYSDKAEYVGEHGHACAAHLPHETCAVRACNAYLTVPQVHVCLRFPLV